MQSKKRAKPVKFGKKADPSVHSGHSAELSRSPSSGQASSGQAHSGQGKEPPKKVEKEPVKKEEPKKGVPKTPEKEDIKEAGTGTLHVSEVEISEIFEPEDKEDEKPAEDTDEEVLSDEKEEPKQSDEETTQDSASVADDEGDTFSKAPEDWDKKGKKSMLPYFFTVASVTFLLGLAFFTGIYFAVSKDGPKFFAAASPTPIIKEEKPTPVPVDLSAYTIEVLNGTNVAGQAGKLKTELEASGFKVGEVGNADSDNFTKTEIAAKKSVSRAYLQKLEEILKKSYNLAPVKQISSGAADVVVTIGSESAN